MNVLLLISQGQDCQRIIDRIMGEGYRVFHASDEDHAKNMATDDQIQVAIIDSENASQSFITKLRRLNSDIYIYVISLIAEQADFEQAEGEEMSADEYLIKPVEPDELISRLVIVNRYRQTLADIRTKQNYLQPIRDLITGTFSRTAIQELIDTEISRCNRFKNTAIIALLELDLANKIQADHGWEMFDRAMAQVGLKVWATLRKYDLIGRWSESQFMLLLPETSTSGAIIVANRLLKNISSVPLSLPGNGQQKLSVSISLLKYDHNNQISREKITESLENLLSKNVENNSIVYTRNTL